MKETEKTENKKKQSDDKIIKSIEDRTIRDIQNLFKQEEDYYKPVRVGNVYINIYSKYGSNGDKNKTLSIREYLKEIKPYLKNIINNLKKYDILKMQLPIAINFISSKDTNEERAINSKNDSIKILIYNKADEIIK